MKTNNFISWLIKISKDNTRVKAELRRSLKFNPGDDFNVYKYVEPFLKGKLYSWDRSVYYLIAGLWANHRIDEDAKQCTFVQACKRHSMNKTTSTNFERQFMILLKTKHEQIPVKLSSILRILKKFNIDFGSLLIDLKYWNYENTVQKRWAQEFYSTQSNAKE